MKLPPYIDSSDRRGMPARSRPASRAGFTLFEVGISLTLVSFGVVSILMIFPLGIKAEQMARYRLLAAAKAEEMIEAFATTANINPTIEVEAPLTWDVTSGHRPFVPDLEVRVVGHRNGVMPLPLNIARRLESDNDEIRQILDQGGQLFYGQATGSTGLEEAGLSASFTNPTESLTQRLVFAVVGHAQNNNVAFLPQKAWPYWQPYPSPPGHGQKNGYTNIPAEYRPKNPPEYDDPAFAYAGQNSFLWEGIASNPTADTPASQGNGTLDTDIRKVFTLGWRPYSYGAPDPPSGPPPSPLRNTVEGAQRYLQVALWYCQKKGLPIDTYDPAPGFDPVTLAKNKIGEFRAVPDDQKWKYVQALRFLSHAATCMTKFKTLVDLGGQPSVGPGFVIPPTTIASDSLAVPGITLTHDKIIYYHELCLGQATLYAASQPYDWGAPRPTQNALFVHYPLMEYDLFTAPTSGLITGTSITASQWKPVTGWPVTKIGRSYSFPGVAIRNLPWPAPSSPPAPSSLWGNPAHFTLTRKFEPAERCRQLVFWAVDWMSYEDCETAPGAPVDASLYLISAPRTGDANTINSRMTWCTWCDHHLYAYRNPEKVITFRQSVSGMPTGSDVSGLRIRNADGAGFDQGTGVNNKYMFQALWGADRNFNGKLDRGPVPTSVRMRATAVARYNFYDPRLTLVLK